MAVRSSRPIQALPLNDSAIATAWRTAHRRPSRDPPPHKHANSASAEPRCCAVAKSFRKMKSSGDASASAEEELVPCVPCPPFLSASCPPASSLSPHTNTVPASEAHGPQLSACSAATHGGVSSGSCARSIPHKSPMRGLGVGPPLAAPPAGGPVASTPAWSRRSTLLIAEEAPLAVVWPFLTTEFGRRGRGGAPVAADGQGMLSSSARRRAAGSAAGGSPVRRWARRTRSSCGCEMSEQRAASASSEAPPPPFVFLEPAAAGGEVRVRRMASDSPSSCTTWAAEAAEG